MGKAPDVFPRRADRVANGMGESRKSLHLVTAAQHGFAILALNDTGANWQERSLRGNTLQPKMPHGREPSWRIRTQRSQAQAHKIRVLDLPGQQQITLLESLAAFDTTAGNDGSLGFTGSKLPAAWQVTSAEQSHKAALLTGMNTGTRFNF